MMKLYDKVYIKSRNAFGIIVDIVDDLYTLENVGYPTLIYWHLRKDDLYEVEACSVSSERYYEGHQWCDIKRLKPGNPRIATLRDLHQVLRECWCKETAYPSCQADWVADDPSYGQCAITAMLVYDMFGGSIHRIRVAGGGTHYFNKIDGEYIDLTAEQFDLYNIPLYHVPNEERDRKYCGKNEDTQRRFELLIKRIKDKLDEA